MDDLMKMNGSHVRCVCGHTGFASGFVALKHSACVEEHANSREHRKALRRYERLCQNLPEEKALEIVTFRPQR